jgi:hypothetical protein
MTANVASSPRKERKRVSRRVRVAKGSLDAEEQSNESKRRNRESDDSSC